MVKKWIYIVELTDLAVHSSVSIYSIIVCKSILEFPVTLKITRLRELLLDIIIIIIMAKIMQAYSGTFSDNYNIYAFEFKLHKVLTINMKRCMIHLLVDN